MAIILIGLAIVWLVLLLQKLGINFSQVCTFIASLLGGLYAFGYNLVTDGWNLIATFAEFFANVWADPIGSVGRLFFGLADVVFGVIESIAGAVDALFGSKLSSAVSGWRDSLQAVSNDLWGENTIKITRMDKVNTADVAAQWGAKGAAFADGVGNLVSRFGSGMGDLTGLLSGNIDSVGSVGEVGKINDDVNIADEDLKLMRDVAEMRYVQNFVRLTPTVSMNAQVSEKADVNEVVSEIERRLESEFSMAAEGVYA